MLQWRTIYCGAVSSPESPHGNMIEMDGFQVHIRSWCARKPSAVHQILLLVGLGIEKPFRTTSGLQRCRTQKTPRLRRIIGLFRQVGRLAVQI